MATSISQQRSALADAIDAPMRHSRRWSVEEAYRYCESLARAHYENFPVGSRIIPRHLRRDSSPERRMILPTKDMTPNIRNISGSNYWKSGA
jgi:hypothetical protein